VNKLSKTVGMYFTETLALHDGRPWAEEELVEYLQ